MNGISLHKLVPAHHPDILLNCYRDLPWEIRKVIINLSGLVVVVIPQQSADVDLQLLEGDAEQRRSGRIGVVLVCDEEHALSC